MVCMLNPSTADETKDDPTIASLRRLTKNNDFAKLIVVNLFALRATNPTTMLSHISPVGPQNWDTWAKVLRELNPSEDTVALAWGRAPKVIHSKQIFQSALYQASKQLDNWTGRVTTWLINADGSPRHPLYIKSSTPLRNYSLDKYLRSMGW